MADDLELAEEVAGQVALIRDQLKNLQRTAPHPDDNKNAIFEIQAGVGGDESSLFVADLFQMYENYCKDNFFTLETTDFNPGNAGGFKDISFTISGPKAYKTFKRENGVHRVQRVPKTETKGRVHTSVVTVIVLPEMVFEEIKIDKNDVEVDNFNSGGKGGQNTNRSMNAVKLTHRPTGIMAVSQLKSYAQNLKLAWQVLATRLEDKQLEQQNSEEYQKRQEIRGTGSRSEKIRTYNYPQDRVSDHRTGTKYPLQTIIAGNISQMLGDLCG